MISIPLKGIELELYTSTKELPITNRQEFYALSMRDFGVGSTTESYNLHFSKLHAYLKAGKINEAIQETKNLHNNYFYIIEKIGIWSYCFMPFIKTINGKSYDKVEIDDHKAEMLKLSKAGLTSGKCEETIFEIKKKLTTNLNSIFLIDTVTMENLTHILN